MRNDDARFVRAAMEHFRPTSGASSSSPIQWLHAHRDRRGHRRPARHRQGPDATRPAQAARRARARGGDPVSAEDDRLRDEAAAWVLGALDNTEAAEFVRRMEASPEVRREVAELQEAADALPFSVVPVGPPPELRDRIMSVVEVRGRAAARHGRARRPPVPSAHALVANAAAPPAGRGVRLRPAPGRRRRRAAHQRRWLGVVADGGRAGHRRRHRERQRAGRDRRRQRAARRGRHAAPGRGHVYQVWYVHDGQTDPVPAGALFDVDSSGQGAAALPGGVDDVKSVLVSVEPPAAARSRRRSRSSRRT